MPDTVRIQGPSYSWSSVLSHFAGVPFRGFTEVTWDEELEVAFGYGAGGHYSPRERSAGKYAPKPAKFTILASAEDALNDIQFSVLADMGFPGAAAIGVAELPTSIQYNELALGPVTTFMEGAKLIKRGQAIKESPEIIVIPCEFSVMRYARKVRGKWTTLWDSRETGPQG